MKKVKGETELIQEAWIDARHPMSHQRLWGLTLLERNIRELHLLGVNKITVVLSREVEPQSNFCYPLPHDVKIVWSSENWRDSLVNTLLQTQEPVLIMEGNLIVDRRLLKLLLTARESMVLCLPDSKGGAMGVLSDKEQSYVITAENEPISQLLIDLVEAGCLNTLDLSDFDPHMISLRRKLNPFLLKVKEVGDLKKAEHLLKLTVHKGVNDFVARFIHPPLEFALTRVLTCKKITPNQVTLTWIFLAAVVTLLFWHGHVLLGAALAALCGILDGVDGKLARLTLRFSQIGDRLDHYCNTLFDGLWYVALGWYFSRGVWHSIPGKLALLLFVSYGVERIVPGLFKKIHGREIYDYSRLDELVRLVGSRMNNNIWLMLIAAIFGLEKSAFYTISVWMFLTAFYHTGRLIWITWFNKNKLLKKSKLSKWKPKEMSKI